MIFISKCVMVAVYAVLMSVPIASSAQDYDIVINNGRVMDPETRFDGVRNMGIKDGKIAIITKKELSGKEPSMQVILW